MYYKVHKFRIRMTQDKDQLEQFLNTLRGEIVAIIPNVAPQVIGLPQVDFLLIVEKVEP